MNNYNEIRKLLELYYEGRTSRAQENELTEFFANAETLPADLEADRRLFGQLADMSAGEVMIPEDFDSRITAAVEDEMSRERAASRRRSRWRSVWIAAGSAAACLLACLPLIRSFIDGTDNTVAEKTPVRTAHHQPAVKPAATEPSGLIAAVEPVKAKTVRAVQGRVADQAEETMDYGRNDSEESPSEVVEHEETYAGYAYLSEEEEEQLVADNYYVVEDEREAYAIVNSVFSRLDGNMAEGSYRVSDINSDYEIEMTKLYN